MAVWSLSSPLLATLVLSYALATTAATPNASNTPTTDVGAYIVSGLGGTTGVSEAASQSTSPANTNSALARISSCSSYLDAFRSSVSSYEYLHGHNTTRLNSFAYTFTSSAGSATTKATSLTRLCDGHPRVVGRATVFNASASVVTSTDIYNVTFSTSATTYPGPTPTCSINEDDCALLWTAYRSDLSSIEATTTGIGPYISVMPPSGCTTAGATPSCDACQIVADHARMLYWPVTTVPGSGDLCNKTAKTITASPTGPPNSFVTEGITITSPTVGVSFGGLSRIDGCGTTVANTIILANPEEIASVRGYRSFFSWWKFNFADLNYICSSNATSDIPVEARDDCYQAVPADAYFAGVQEQNEIWMYSPEMVASLTIWPDYRPRLLPPDTMLPVISSLWAKNNDSCTIHPLGVWDPPVALTEQVAADGVSIPTTTTSEDGISMSTPAAAPAQYTTSPVSATAVSEVATAAATASANPVSTGDESAPATGISIMPSSSTQSVLLSILPVLSTQGAASQPSGSGDPSSSVASTSSQDAGGAIVSLLVGGDNSAAPSATDPSQTTSASTVDGPSSPQDPNDPSAATSATNADSAVHGVADPAVAPQTSDAAPTAQSGVDPATAAVTLGSSVVQVASATGDAGGIIVGSSTLVPGDPGRTIDGQIVSAGTDGLVVGSGSAASTVVITQGGEPAISAASGSGPQASTTEIADSETSGARSTASLSSSSGGAAPVRAMNAGSMVRRGSGVIALFAVVCAAVSSSL